MNAIYRKDLKSAFCNMTAVVLIAYVLFIMGFYTVSLNLNYGGSGMGYAQFEYTLASAAIPAMLALPVITVRSFSEEKHAKTDCLLYSLPIGTGSVVAAKYLSMVTVFAIPTAALGLFPFILSLFGTVHLNTAYATLLMWFLLGCTLIAIGMFISSTTESSVISAIVSMCVIVFVACAETVAAAVDSKASVSFAAALGVCILLGILTGISTKETVPSVAVSLVTGGAATAVYVAKSELYEGLLSSVIEKFALFSPVGNTASGILDLKSVLFYLSVIAFFVFLTVRSAEKKRWN